MLLPLFPSAKEKTEAFFPILHLRPLNSYPKREKFKMLTLPQVLSPLNHEDWKVARDLQKPFFNILILKTHHRYLRLTVGHKHFQFAVLPFGFTIAP